MEYYTNETSIKPFFDIDVVLDEKSKKQYIKDMDDNVRCGCKELIIAKYTNKDITLLTCPIRKILDKHDTKVKISYRFVVDKAMTNVDT